MSEIGFFANYVGCYHAACSILGKRKGLRIRNRSLIGEDEPMKPKSRCMLLLVFAAALNGPTFGQTTQQQRNVVVNGQHGKADVIEQNGRMFVDVSALASIGKGSVGFSGSGFVLSIPAATSDTATSGVAAPPSASSPPTNSAALSQQFMRAGIEEIARLREWATTLASAVRGGYGVTDEWVNGYRDQASQSLQLAQAAASTDGDHNAAQLLQNAFDLVQKWSDKLVAAKQSMDTAKYTTSPNALRDDPLSQKLITCGHFLTQMLGSATFQDDASCH